MKNEPDIIRGLFQQLIKATRLPFPAPGRALQCPTCQGVYIIYDANGRVGHVGRTTRAREDLHQRLRGHLRCRSSFVNKYLKGDARQFRAGYSYALLEVADARRRALVEAYATGVLCPLHIGTGESTNDRI